MSTPENILRANRNNIPLTLFQKFGIILMSFITTYTVKTRVPFRYLKTDTFECLNQITLTFIKKTLKVLFSTLFKIDGVSFSHLKVFRKYFNTRLNEECRFHT
jgi:hypothetical protein